MTLSKKRRAASNSIRFNVHLFKTGWRELCNLAGFDPEHGAPDDASIFHIMDIQYQWRKQNRRHCYLAARRVYKAVIRRPELWGGIDTLDFTKISRHASCFWYWRIAGGADEIIDLWSPGKSGDGISRPTESAAFGAIMADCGDLAGELIETQEGSIRRLWAEMIGFIDPALPDKGGRPRRGK